MSAPAALRHRHRCHGMQARIVRAPARVATRLRPCGDPRLRGAEAPHGTGYRSVLRSASSTAETCAGRVSLVVNDCFQARASHTPGIPRMSRFLLDFKAAYARARELQAEHFVDELSLIADDGRNDFMEKVRQNGETFVDANREHLERSKIRIATRQWIVERILSGKYGPKPQVVV